MAESLYDQAGADIIDSRDLDERLTELKDADKDLTDEEELELDDLTDISDEVGSEWEYGVVLILDDHFEDYAQELAEDIGAINHELGWPLNHIDWEAAADALRIDYSTVTIGGYEYLWR